MNYETTIVVLTTLIIVFAFVLMWVLIAIYDIKTKLDNKASYYMYTNYGEYPITCVVEELLRYHKLKMTGGLKKRYAPYRLERIKPPRKTPK